MEWSSPWGVGFPGWHIECSAISLKYLGKNLDIHCGGADHINIHHTNEIAQSEAATGKTFFNYWLHGAFLNIVGGKKMAKSEDGFLTLKKALIDKGLNPLAYRFADCQVHYRKPMEYSEDNLRQAEQGLDKLWEQVATLGSVKGKIDLDLQEKFVKAVNDDLNIPKALAVLASIFKAKISSADKLATVLDFDKIFGFDLKNSVNYIKGEVSSSALPVKIQELAAARLKARLNKDWKESDKLRDDIKAAGYSIEDTAAGQKIKKN